MGQTQRECVQKHQHASFAWPTQPNVNHRDSSASLGFKGQSADYAASLAGGIVEVDWLLFQLRLRIIAALLAGYYSR